MPPKRVYRNSIRSKQMIRDSFVALLHEKPFEKITATDIINRSGLNRSTFYAHYPDVKGLMEEFTGEIVDMFRQMLEEMDFSQFLHDPEPNLKQVLSFMEENQELYRMLGKSDMSLIHLEELKKVLVQQVLETPNLPTDGLSPVGVEIHIRLLMSGIIDIYRGWLANEIKCSLEEITAQVAQVIQNWTK